DMAIAVAKRQAYINIVVLHIICLLTVTATATKYKPLPTFLKNWETVENRGFENYRILSISEVADSSHVLEQPSFSMDKKQEIAVAAGQQRIFDSKNDCVTHNKNGNQSVREEKLTSLLTVQPSSALTALPEAYAVDSEAEKMRAHLYDIAFDEATLPEVKTSQKGKNKKSNREELQRLRRQYNTAQREHEKSLQMLKEMQQQNIHAPPVKEPIDLYKQMIKYVIESRVPIKVLPSESISAPIEVSSEEKLYDKNMRNQKRREKNLRYTYSFGESLTMQHFYNEQDDCYWSFTPSGKISCFPEESLHEYQLYSENMQVAKDYTGFYNSKAEAALVSPDDCVDVLKDRVSRRVYCSPTKVEKVPIQASKDERKSPRNVEKFGVMGLLFNENLRL
ncbi:hypothetical protein IE077_002672, partial [Cardiosporidium cionae]